MKIIEQGKFCDLGSESLIASKLIKLGVVRVRYGEQPFLDAAATIASLCAYVVVEDILKDYPEQAYIPDWLHIGAHERVGRLYWNCFRARHPRGVLCFHDQPDMSGRLASGTPFVGDINQVGLVTFNLTMRQMPRHSLWISVSETKQIIIEPLVSLSKLPLFDQPDLMALVNDTESDETQWAACQYAPGHRMPVNEDVEQGF